MQRMIFIMAGVLIFLSGTFVSAQELNGQLEIPRTYDQPVDTNVIIFEGEQYIFAIVPPAGWVTDLDNAAHDGYTAAMFPDSASYFRSRQIIYIWIFPLDSMSFEQFVSADSASYLASINGLIFSERKIVSDSTENDIVVLEAYDPGGKTDLAALAYIDGEDEIIVLQLSIYDRMYYADARASLNEVLANFAILPRTPNEE
ncbi:MAG: hypothetical protein JW763_06625 [candidate division Zixibacteria bacterium]|nr:hypothetical protein [candidate division Zixibacteria bacterium]